MIRLSHLVDGQARDAASGHWLDLHDPSRASVYGQCPAGDSADVDAAVAAARAAFPAWSAFAGSERARWLNTLADVLETRLEDFARAESRDAGKPLALARDIEIPRAVSNLRFFAAAALQFASESHQGEAGLNVTLRQPLGVVACISPWNLPLYLFTWKIAPALAAGNTVVAKPSEVTPVTAWMLGELAREIGFPAGALNIVQGTGPDAGRPLVEHPGVKAVSFTGSTAVGRAIAVHCAGALKKASLELGGKNPTLVFADAARDEASRARLFDTVLRSAFQNSGQICLCGSRILVERGFYAEFRDELVARARALPLGDPSDPGMRIGPMVSRAHFDKVMGYLQLAREEGGTVLCGGGAPDLGGGWYIQPTVIEGLGPEARCNREEIFGPVVTLQAFDTEAEALSLANASDYGLAASLWTADLGRAQRMAGALECGIIWVNGWLERDLRTPFGGMKQSGLGREGGLEAMRFFTEAKNVCFHLE